MITKEEKQFILKYVDAAHYDQEKLIKYLNMHDIVGNEIFSYCDKRSYRKDQPTYSTWLDDEDGYVPLSVSDFIRRIPFYFYTKDVESMDLDNMGTLNHIFYASSENRNIEDIYHKLEYAFYHMDLPLNRIFSYWINQFGSVFGEGFFQWCHYLHLCEEYGHTDYFPNRFITSYNEMLEKAGLDPIIYEINMTGLYGPFVREGRFIKFEGNFPCDENGNPIMKWIGIKATNVEKFSCSCEKSKRGYLSLEITPKTVIHALNYCNSDEDDGDLWDQVYAGPMTMSFDHTVLRERRKKLGYSQKDVALAIGTTVRTYQKWESGETTPNGHYLVRLINWLDIIDVQYVVQYKDFED